MNMFERVKQIRSERDLFPKMVGITTEEIREGYARVEAEIIPEHANTFGSLHGGLLFTMADSASASVAMSDGFMKTTLNCTFDYLRSAKNPKKLICEATVVKNGRSVSVYESTVKDETGKLLARGTFTYFNLGTPLFPEE